MYIAHINRFGAEQTCEAHSRGTAAISGDILRDIGLYDAGYLAGLLHDCGKFSDDFTEYIRKAVEGVESTGKVIHTFAGVALLLNRFHSNGVQYTIDDITAEMIAAAIGSHHGLFDLLNEDGESGFLHRLQKQPERDGKAARELMRSCASEEEIDRRFRKASIEIGTILRKTADSFQNDKGKIKSTKLHYSCGLLTRMLLSAVIEGDRTDTAAFMNAGSVSSERAVDINGLWEMCSENIRSVLEQFDSNLPINRARMELSEAAFKSAQRPSGIYRMDIPTGGGKTLTAFRFAVEHARVHGKKHVFYVAPLLSILEQNAKVIRKAAAGEDVVLEHYSDAARDLESPEELKRVELFQENWNVPIIVTSLVRMLETMFSGKMSAVRRFHALCESVLIFDEIQSLPGKMLSMFNQMLNFLTGVCGATVVLCSATQPAFEKADIRLNISEEPIIPHELTDRCSRLFQRTHISDSGTLNMEELEQMIYRMISGTNSLLIVCNTRREAENLYAGLNGEFEKYHLSANMCMAHRQDILTAIREALDMKRRIVCVSTQVIEAGIDISFESVIRLSAGIDSIVQAAGRCNRNGEFGDIKEVRIVRLAGEKLGSLREIVDAQNAMNQLLAEFENDPAVFDNDIASKVSISCYYERLFGAMRNGEQDYIVPGHSASLFSMLADNPKCKELLSSSRKFYLNQAAKTAGKLFEVFDDSSETLYVPYGDEGREAVKTLLDPICNIDQSFLKNALKRASRFRVSVYSNTIRQLEEQGAIQFQADGGILILKEDHYNEFGVSVDTSGKEKK